MQSRESLDMPLAQALPAPLAPLATLAYNLRWSWHPQTIALFRQLDGDLWESTGHNPVLLLQTVERDRLEGAAADEGFLAELARVAADLDRYLGDNATWFGQRHGGGEAAQVAYFSMEFGLTECLPIYSGGLGVLAGDHLKSASDLGVPLVGVGLFYRRGYFDQSLDASGWQQDSDEDNDPARLPLAPVLGADGERLLLTLPFPGHTLTAQAWRAQIGRVALYLLDADVPANAPEDRGLTARLYGGDADTRIRQEFLLGVGGYRLLAALGLAPRVCHMNEGHAAFLALERARELMRARGLSFAEAREAANAGLVFTTHTPVPAGHDYFSPDLMERYFADYMRELETPLHELLALGRKVPDDYREYFCMTTLALRSAAHSNGVSALHGAVSRDMWTAVWPDRPAQQSPIGHVTNGVHLPSWLSREMAALYARFLGPDWGHGLDAAERRARAARIPAAELWRVHRQRRASLLTFARQHLRAQLERHGLSEPRAAGEAQVLNPAALTIGFARRFATYKRAALLFRDQDRLARIIGNPDRPVQFLFAGKAHPRDEGGKLLIQRIVELSRQEPFRGRLIFLEDYDMAVARFLVQGADVWLNNPQRPYEASGTSGMKAAANGVLNLSTLDGWWAEAWEAARDLPDPPGWAIGRGEQFEDAEHQAWVDSQALYALLEEEVVPAFYDRDAAGIPQAWTRRMRAALAELSPVFSTDRMVRQYTEEFYLPGLAVPAGVS